MAVLGKVAKQNVLRELTHRKTRLQARLNRVSAEVRRRLADCSRKKLGNHPADQVDAPDLDLTRTIPSLQKQLEKMQGVIAKLIETDEYGTCTSCGEEILVGRLLLVPFATLCTKCGNEKEDARKKNGYVRRATVHHF